MEKNRFEKKCWACKRILLIESKTGLCQECLNKYGSLGVLIGSVLGGGTLVKYGPKLIKKLLKK